MAVLQYLLLQGKATILRIPMRSETRGDSRFGGD